MELNHKLTSIEFDRAVNNKTNANDHQLEDKGGYQRIVSRLLYLTMIRPDIIFVVKVLSQYMHALKQSHLEAAMRVVRYIKNAPGLGLIVPTDNTLKIAAYCDSDWRACVETRKSITGYAIKFGDALISWKSKKQETMSRSSAEAEFRSMAANVAKIIWMIGLFKELGSEIAANPIFHKRTKHIDIDCHFVREKNQEGKIQTQHTRTKEQLADLLTKSMCRPQHDYLMDKLGMKNMYSSLSLRGSIEVSGDTNVT
ncbi:secreted RxLR effector protein 161-like [Nicotiana tabacum]|uniref:Secreted RxLR effector protein 161-like n=1 Tax=Nicotiana tabacum TaxID=4097 RepID=A0AC58TX62_TOBAC